MGHTVVYKDTWIQARIQDSILGGAWKCQGSKVPCGAMDL